MRWRNILLCLSFANLVYLRSWSDLFPPAHGDLFFSKTLPGYGLYLAVAADVCALALAAFLLTCLEARLPGWLKRLLLSAALLLVALALRSFLADTTGFLRSGLFRFFPPKVLFAVAVVAATCAVAACFKFYASLLRFSKAAASTALPCLVITFGGSLYYLHGQSPLPPDPPLAARLPARPVRRVVWIIFDEWDQRLTFTHRSAAIRLPELDELAAHSFTATRALAVQVNTAVAKMSTAESTASLLYGKLVTRSRTRSSAITELSFSDGSSTVFGEGESIFAQLRNRGWNSAAVGWYLPYCRIFASQLAGCYWDHRYLQRLSARPQPFDAAIDETRMLFETSMFSLFGASLVADRHASEYQALLTSARRYVADPAIGLTFVHFNIPHTPYFYSAHHTLAARSGYSAARYDATLELVDRTISDLRRALAAACLADKTAIILSADHPARFATRIDGGQDAHVPFIVYLPGQNAGSYYQSEFSTVSTAKLAMALTSGQVKSFKDVEQIVAPQ